MASPAPSVPPVVRTPDRRDHALDGLRGLAALSVLCFHTWLYRTNRHQGSDINLLDRILREANVGLICFFVLSGYLLYRAFARAALSGAGPVGVRSYGLRRAARIVPAYYVVCAISLLLYAIVGYDASTPALGQLPLFAVFGQNYSIHTVMHIDPVTWTLAIEAAFYVALPLLGLLAWRLGPQRIGWQIAMLLGLIVLTIAWNAIVFAHRWDAVASKSLPAWLGEFAMGMLVAQWVVWRELRHGGAARLRGGVTAALGLAGAAVVFGGCYWYQSRWLSGTTERYVALYLVEAAGFALIIAAVVTGRGRLVTGLSWRPLAALGVISYGVYLWHLPLILVLKHIGWLPAALAPRLLVVFALAVAFGVASWRLVERPSIAWAATRARRFGGRQSAARAPLAEPLAVSRSGSA
jgi:peptidoglycan/LPS O-acetylase OafA/YrhL